MKIGLIGDTHGLLRTEALEALADCDHLLHAGDIGIDTLSQTAPLTAVRGNNDEGLAWASALPEGVELSLGGLGIYLTHQAADVPAYLPDSVRVVVTGHSHKPLIQERDGRLWINPGSAGPRRFKLPISVALLHLENGAVRAELVALS